nr:DUF882 domain-containing protein [Roseomonas acroporae]
MLGALACVAFPGVAAQAAAQPERRLHILRVQTGDRFGGVYWRDGCYDRDALRRLDWVMRDPRQAEATPMDPRLFDVLNAVALRLDAGGPFHINSGYRAPATNALYARRSSRVSQISLHMSGMAADLSLPGRDPVAVARVAAAMQVGGVGLYREGFVHLDCGPARRW